MKLQKIPILYKYPEANINTVVNIGIQLLKNPCFYIKVCHLMNLLCLEPPFDEHFSKISMQNADRVLKSKISESIGKSQENSDLSEFSDNFSSDNEILDKIELTIKNPQNISEIRKLKTRNLNRKQKQQKLREYIIKLKRKHLTNFSDSSIKSQEIELENAKTLKLQERSKNIRKIKQIPIQISDENIMQIPDLEEEKINLSENNMQTFIHPNEPEKQIIFDTKEIPRYDLDDYYNMLNSEINKTDNKKEENFQPPLEENIGKNAENNEFDIWFSDKKKFEIPEQIYPDEWNAPNSLEELQKNKQENLHLLAKFQSKNPSQPNSENSKLYVKNIPKKIDSKSLEKLVKLILHEYKLENALFEIKVMQKGKMRGQGFIDFQTKEIAKIVKNELHGYTIFNKPLIIEFSKTNK